MEEKKRQAGIEDFLTKEKRKRQLVLENIQNILATQEGGQESQKGTPTVEPTGMKRPFGRMSVEGQQKETEKTFPKTRFGLSYSASGEPIIVQTPESKQKQKMFGKMMEIDTAWEKSGLTNNARSKLLGSLRAGNYRHPFLNKNFPLKNKEQAEEFLLQAGYLHYQEDPEIMEIINSLSDKEDKQPKESDFFSFLGKGEEESLPKGITEEDIQYTMKIHGLSREEVLRRIKSK